MAQDIPDIYRVNRAFVRAVNFDRGAGAVTAVNVWNDQSE
jgi:hypothetical protein